MNSRKVYDKGYYYGSLSYDKNGINGAKNIFRNCIVLIDYMKNLKSTCYERDLIRIINVFQVAGFNERWHQR